MWDIVWVSLQGHRSVSVSCHFLLQATQCPCSVRKRFSRDHIVEECQNPVAGLWGRTLGKSWPPEPTSSFACIDFRCQQTRCKSSHSGFLDASRSNGGLSISGWIGQLSCLTVFSTSLSVAAFLRRAGGSMLVSTGSHGRGVERRVSKNETHGRVQLHIDPTCVSRAWPDWGAVLCCLIAKCQSRWPQSIGAGAPGGTG